MKRTLKLLLMAVILCGCIGCDQVTKDFAKRTLQNTAPISLWHDTVRLHYTENAGAFLSAGAFLPDVARFWILLVFPACLLGGLLMFGVLSPGLNSGMTVSLSLFIGGGLGNLLDRWLQHGYVSDFLNIGVATLRTGVFNLADVFILLGVAGFLVFYRKRDDIG